MHVQLDSYIPPSFKKSYHSRQLSFLSTENLGSTKDFLILQTNFLFQSATTRITPLTNSTKLASYEEAFLHALPNL
jgi:hypothetical protein